VTSVATGHRPALPLTGERTVPGHDGENYWFRRHEVAYQAVLPWCRDATVLDAGCGEGYGAARVAAVARRVLALDYEAATVAHVAARYPGLSVLRANLAALPLADGCLDTVVCLQVVEHLWDQHGFLAECARVLRPGGTLIVTTPNRLTFSPGRDTPLNPFHTRELSPPELADLLEGAGLRVRRMLGVRHGPRLRQLDRRNGGSLVAAQLAAPVSEWDGGLARDVASVRADDFLLRPDDLDTCLALFAVATPSRQDGTPAGTRRP
jgi:SAM-dependent methyltransferase